MINLLLGLGFAWSARDRIRADGPFAGPAFAVVLIFSAVLMFPIGLYLYLAHPAWWWMYFVDPANVPGLAVIPIVVAQTAALVAGWYLAAKLLRAGRPRIVGGVAGGATVTLLVIAIVLRERLLQYGDYIDWQRSLRHACGPDQLCTLALMEVKLGYVLVALALGISAGAGYVVVELFRDSRRVRMRG